jgi:predicted nucleic acid-binding protein
MKLVLDTNVVSQLVHPQGSVQIKDWLATRRGYIVYTTSVTQAEILFGIASTGRKTARSNVSECVGGVQF